MVRPDPMHVHNGMQAHNASPVNVTRDRLCCILTYDTRLHVGERRKYNKRMEGIKQMTIYIYKRA